MKCIYDDGNCSTDGISKRGMCTKHYTRWRNHGDPTKTMYMRGKGTELERWSTKYAVRDNDCWEWQASRTKNGYGNFKSSLPGREAHRFGYIYLVGPIAKGLELDHLCRNRLCVNPAHLEPVTHAENVRRGNAGIRNKEKTHCKWGHEFTPSNTLLTESGRNCRECQRKNMENFKARRAAQEITGGPPRN